MHSRSLVLVAAAFVVATLAPGRALAHDLRATVRLPGDAVVVLAYFDDDTPAEGAKVVITDAAGNDVASGKADDKGLCRLPKLGPGKYRAVVESAGHRDEVEFPVESEGAIEYSRTRPDRAIGLALGVGGLLAASAGFWWLRRK